MLKQQQRRKPINRRRDHHNMGHSFQNGNTKGFHHNGHGNNQSNHHHNNNNNNKMQKAASPTISNIAEFPEPVTFGSFDYPQPSCCQKPAQPHVINDIPSFPQRPAAVWKASFLGSTFIESLQGPDKTRMETDTLDPAMKIVLSKRKGAKTFKLGSVEIDIYKKTTHALTGTLHGTTKLVNKFLHNDGLGATTTPLKRNRDEVVEVSSSMKKNRRMHDLQADTTMELSFEGKAMDKSDLVKLVDSSGIMQDESHMVDVDTSMMNIDTRNLLHNSEFNFEYKRA